MCNKLILLLLLFTSNAFAELTFSPTLKNGNITVSNSNQTISGGSVISWAYLEVTLPISGGGKYYYEYTWDSGSPSGQYTGIELRNDAPSVFFNGSYPFNVNGLDNTGGSFWWLSSFGTLFYNTASAGAPPVVNYTTGATVMVAIDIDNQKLYQGANGSWGSSDPATNTGGADLSAAFVGNTDIYLPIAIGGPEQLTLNQTATQTIPSGFTYLSNPSTAGSFLPIPTPNTPPVTSVSTKGGLLTKDVDLKRVEFPACANGKILGFNSSTATGLDCLDNL